MNRDSFRVLEKIYCNYRDLLKTKKKLKSESVLLSSIDIKNNARFRALSDASLAASDVSHDALKELIRSDFLREAEEPSKYTITAKGVWEVESKSQILDTERIVTYIDDKFFDVFEKSGGLTEKEKIIILSMLSARAFSKESAVDLYRDDTIDGWRDIIEKTYDELRMHGVIDRLGKNEIYGTSASERPISNLLRHTDGLQRKTRGLFRAPGKQKYYLAVCEGEELLQEKLSYLFGQVYTEGLDVALVYDVYDFCKKVAHDDGFRVFDVGKHIFANHVYDASLMKAIKDAALRE